MRSTRAAEWPTHIEVGVWPALFTDAKTGAQVPPPVQSAGPGHRISCHIPLPLLADIPPWLSARTEKIVLPA